MSQTPPDTDGSSSHRLRTLLAGFFFVLMGTFSGFLLGAVYAKLIMHRAGMGWDRLADTLGALMLGSASGFVLSLLVVFWFAHARKLLLYVMLLVSLLAFVLLYRGQQEPSIDAVPATSAVVH